MYEDGHNPDLAIFDEVIAPSPPYRYIRGDVKERTDLTKYTHTELHALVASKGFNVIEGHPYQGLSPEEIVARFTQEQQEAKVEAAAKNVPLHMQPGFQIPKGAPQRRAGVAPDESRAPEDGPTPEEKEAMRAAAREAEVWKPDDPDPADERLSKEAARRHYMESPNGHEDL